MKRIIILPLYLLILSACSPDQEVNPVQDPSDNSSLAKTEIIDLEIEDKHQIDLSKDTLSFLALGDSYTIGTAVETRFRWPLQFADSLASTNINLNAPEIVASAGWTSGNLLQALDTKELNASYDLISLLIGVNNQYQNKSFEEFQSEFIELLKFSMTKAKSRSSIFVLSIPDYGITPFGGGQDSISEEIDMYNTWIKWTCDVNKIKFYDITEISRKAENDLTFLAPDNLHPSGKMYAEWVQSVMSDLPNILIP